MSIIDLPVQGFRVVEERMVVECEGQDGSHLRFDFAEYFFEGVAFGGYFDFVEGVVGVELHPQQVRPDWAHPSIIINYTELEKYQL